ncbi:hypothetical protein O0550_23510 [Brevibacillus halotolerans]|uniref:hypothetical protein n=1 Tax=Brevibacillus TaxID=55080 RepID=UPI00215BF885|nr:MULTISPECIES: hypothetical protein [Brevibacillus]MCR8966115.1 hypothetical protein [Brevibacillus laterosporus]MCZ0838272.1 hypothetical protein [Brevibacillus halotolerans]
MKKVLTTLCSTALMCSVVVSPVLATNTIETKNAETTGLQVMAAGDRWVNSGVITSGEVELVTVKTTGGLSFSGEVSNGTVKLLANGKEIAELKSGDYHGSNSKKWPNLKAGTYTIKAKHHYGYPEIKGVIYFN